MNSVASFLEQYEWGYPFDQRENDMDEYLLMKQLDRAFLKLESKRFEPDRAEKPEQRKKEATLPWLLIKSRFYPRTRSGSSEAERFPCKEEGEIS